MDRKFWRTASGLLGIAAATPGISVNTRKMLGAASAIAGLLSYLT